MWKVQWRVLRLSSAVPQAAATSMAMGLARPSNRVSSEGSPKMLEPTIALTTSAVSVQRPIERMRGMNAHPGWVC
jgi:hypothetical protein